MKLVFVNTSVDKKDVIREKVQQIGDMALPNWGIFAIVCSRNLGWMIRASRLKRRPGSDARGRHFDD